MSEYPVPEIPPQPPQPVVEENHHSYRSMRGGWLPGLILIVLGGVFLLQNMGLVRLDNWWALFILIPAFGALGAAYSAFVNNGGRLNSEVLGSLAGGVILTVLAMAFLFQLDFDLIWPSFLIIGGLAALAGAFARR